MKITRFIFAVFVLEIVLANRQTAEALDHSGTCTGTFAVADNPHRLTDSCTVPVGQTLTFAPGVIVNGQGNVVYVYGQLVAEGTVGQPVTLNQTHLNFQPGSTGSVIHSRLTPANCCSGGIAITSASPTISGNTFSGFGGQTALTVNGGAQPVISGNTLGTVSTGIQVSGSARPTISANTMTTNGVGIAYSGEAAGSVTGNTISFVLAGNSSREGILVQGAASPTLSGNSINDDPTRADTGINVGGLSLTSAVQVLNNAICATGTDIPLKLSPEVFRDTPLAQISGNTFPCGVGGGWTLNGVIATNSTLRPLNGQSTYALSSSLSVNGGARLTLPPGTVLNGQGNVVYVYGTLQADGAALANVFVNFQANSSGAIQNSLLTGPSFNTTITVNGVSPSFTGNTFKNMGTVIGLTGSTNVMIDGNTFDSVTTGVSILGDTARSQVSNNTFRSYAVGKSRVKLDHEFPEMQG